MFNDGNPIEHQALLFLSDHFFIVKILYFTQLSHGVKPLRVHLEILMGGDLSIIFNLSRLHLQ